MIKIGNNISNLSTYSYRPTSRDELKKIINERIFEFGYNCDLNDIDISLITDMTGLFYDSDFNGNISKWNTSNVKSMTWMFYCSKFDGDISDWDVSKVEDMECMFRESDFNQDISNWNIHNCNTNRMFKNKSIKDSYKPKALR